MQPTLYSEIRTDAIRDEAVLGTLADLAERKIPCNFANLCHAAEIFDGAAPAPADGSVWSPEIPAEKPIPELYRPPCGGPEGWLGGIACDLSLFPGAEGAGEEFPADPLSRGAELSCRFLPAWTGLAGAYTAASAAFVRAAAALSAQGAAPHAAAVSFPLDAAGLSTLCAAVDGALAFGLPLTASVGEAAITLSAEAVAPRAARFAAAGHPVWFFAAPVSQDSLPELSAVAAMQADFRRRIAEGELLSAWPVGTAGPAEAILSLAGELGFHAREGLDLFAFLLQNHGGLIAESERPVSGALLLGTTDSDGRFLFPDGRGAKISDLRGFHRAALRAGKAK